MTEMGEGGKGESGVGPGGRSSRDRDSVLGSSSEESPGRAAPLACQVGETCDLLGTES